MQMHPLLGHHKARQRLASSLRAGRLPQVILLTGPEGVGKQRLGLWLAQLMLCQGGAAGAEPCGSCRACKQVLELSHPDLHWFVPIPRPKAADADKQVEEAAELLAEAITARREEPWYRPADGMAFHPLASARLLLRRAALTPVEGKRKVFLLGEAERLVPQESSPEAANALLKLLEEPPADTWVMLTTTEPERVLATIRSRAVPLRLYRLADTEVREAALKLLRPAPAPSELQLLVARAEGAIGALAGSDGSLKAAEEARGLLTALKSGGPALWERSLKQSTWSARGGFTELLDAVAAELAARAKSAGDAVTARRLVTGLERVRLAREDAQGNVNPQLVLGGLALELAELL